MKTQFAILMCVVSALGQDVTPKDSGPDFPVKFTGDSRSGTVTIRGSLNYGQDVWVLAGPMNAALSAGQHFPTSPGTLGRGNVEADLQGWIGVAGLAATLPPRTNRFESADLYFRGLFKPELVTNIYLSLTHITMKGDPLEGSEYRFDSKGTLACAGVTNGASIPLRVSLREDGTLRISGETEFKLWDFNIRIGKLNFLEFSLDNDVRLSFECVFAEPAALMKVRFALGWLKAECDFPGQPAEAMGSFISSPESHRLEAIWSLKSAPNEAVVEIRRDSLSAPPEYKQMLTIALAVLGDPQALTNACELMLKSDKPAVRVCAAAALRRLAKKEALESFKQALHDPYKRRNRDCAPIAYEFYYPVRYIASSAVVELGVPFEEVQKIRGEMGIKWPGLPYAQPK